MNLIVDSQLLTRPIGCLVYTKPHNYLVLALVESGLDWQAIQSKIAYACSRKKAWYRCVYRAWAGK